MSKAQIRQGIMEGTIPSAVSDTGATSTAGTPTDPFNPSDKPSSKVFCLPTGGRAAATGTATLQLDVRAPADEVDIVPNLDQTLLSTSKFAEAGYTTVYDKNEVNFYNSNTIKIDEEAVLRGYRCPRTGLWRVPLQPIITNENVDTLLLDSKCGTQSLNLTYSVTSTSQTHEHLKASIKRDANTIYNVYELPSIEQSIRYLHAAAGFPTKATWLKAIRRGNYNTWPLVNVKNVNKHFPESEETQQGHMRTQRQGVRSTKIKIKLEDEQNENDPPPPTKQNYIIVNTYDTHDTMFTDQTGKFPHLSSRGNRYQMILYHSGSNSIWVEPTKNKTEGEMILARDRALTRMRACNILPKRQVLDNEASAAYKQAIKESGMDYQLVPPDDHRRNIAEKAIQTWKDHFIAALSGTANNFPMHLWCQTIPQMERQLNLLHQSNSNPKISTYAHLYGHHDYNSVPFVPIGIESMAHDKPRRRKTFAQHCSKGWILGTSPEHYRCYNHWSNDTRTTRITATVFLKHKYITNPVMTPADAITAAAANLAHTIENNVKAQHIDQTKLNDLKRLQHILKSTATHPKETTEQPEEPPQLLPGYDNNSNNDEEEDIPPPRVIPPPKEVPPPRVIPSPRVTPSPRANPIPTPQPIFEVIPEQTASTPAQNTRSRNIRTITQETILSTINIHQGHLSARQASQRKYPKEALAAVLNEETGELMEYQHLVVNPKYRDIYKPAYGKELGRLAQGIPGTVKGTDTIAFIHKNEVPADRWKDITYGRICANFRPEKADPHRIRLTVGGNLINFPGDCGTPTAGMLTVKILLNSTISTPGAKFMTIDIKNFYLNTPMERPEFMRLKIADMPENIIEQYQLKDKVTADGYIYVRVQKGMYGLPQAGIIAQQLLEKRLNARGYHQSPLTPGYWTHNWRPISFTLVVDDFGVKYVGKEHADHLLQTINANYETSHEWEGTRYIGLTIDWDYIQRFVHISMPGYCAKACLRFKHAIPRKRQDQPYPSIERTYGAKQQFAEADDNTPVLPQEQKTFIQEVIGVFLYYARAVDCTMLAALGSLASQQAKPTQTTMERVRQFLDYAATNQDATITYRASDMVLAAHSDASYLSETKARSRAGGHFFLSENNDFPANNGAVLTISQIIKAVMSSAAEAELGALYINSREAIPQRHLLIEMGHPQPPTPMQVDNSTALGVVKKTMQQKQTKAMDMRFHWLRCRINQKQFRTYWRAGSTNLGDYVTKHHPAIHHKTIRPVYLTSKSRLADLKQKATSILTRMIPTARVC